MNPTLTLLLFFSLNKKIFKRGCIFIQYDYMEIISILWNAILDWLYPNIYEENKCAFIYLDISSIWYLETSAWLDIQFLSVVWHHVAINIVWYVMFLLLWLFDPFSLRISKPFVYLRELIFLHFKSLCSSFYLSSTKSAILLLLVVTWSKPILYPQNKSASVTKQGLC